MAPPKITATAPPASPTPGPSTDAVRNRIAEALHSWCQTNFDFGYVFSQDELLDAGIIPNKDIRILLSAVQHLTGQNLFKVHDRTGGTIGWELVDQERANKYITLTPLAHSVSVLTFLSTAMPALLAMRDLSCSVSTAQSPPEYGPG